MIENITKHLNFSFTKKLSIILQTEVTECGLACIAMIANYYGHQVNLLSLRRKFPTSLKGTNLQELTDIARQFHLSSRAVKLDLEELKLLKTPCILHWDLDHFVVLKKILHNGDAIIYDPAIGIVKYKISELSKHFTGIAMELIPATDFQKKKDKAKLYLSDLWKSIIGIKVSLIQILLISLGLELFGVISPWFIQLVTDEVIVARDFSLLYVLAIGFGMLVLTQALTKYIRSWVVIFISNSLNIQLVANLMHHLLKLPIDFFEKRHMGDIISKFRSVNSIQEKISTEFVTGIVDGFMISITLLVMLFYSPSLTVIVLAALTIYIAVRIIFYSTAKYYTQASIITSAKEQSVFMETIRAISAFKIFRKESQREGIWQNCYADNLNNEIKLSKLNLIYSFFINAIFEIERIIIILFGASLIMNNKNFSIGMLMAYLAYRQQLVDKAQQMIDKIIEYQMIRVHLDRISDITLTKPELGIIQQGSMVSEVIKGKIIAQDLSFRYSEQEPYIFKNVNFEVKAGEILAIVGASGCGKTTLIKVLLRLLTQSSGNILIDDINIKKIGLQNYRSQIAAVMQEDILLTGSVAENICFFDPKPDFNFIYSCAMMASIHNEIAQMPMAYNTLIGDMGTSLSGGQKQRILFARALYFKPKILFLDEATSHLDTTNESLINQHIKQLGITRIIVAHRKETINIADKILDLSNIYTYFR